MLRFVFIPCWSGDYRLEHTSDVECVLTVEDPTDADRKRLSPFLLEVIRRGALTDFPFVRPRGKTLVPIAMSLREAGPLLAGAVAPDAWTAVRCVNGKVSVSDKPLERGVPDDAEAVGAVQRPSLGCPAPAAAARRASQVLAAFSTASQYESFRARGFLRAVGNYTGRAYHVFHRDEARRRGMGHCLAEAASGLEVCAWDDRVPAEEEVLGLKLAVEHRESWLRGGAVAQLG